MSIESSSIWTEVMDIIKKAPSRDLFEYKATVHTAKEDLGVWDMNTVEITRDYLTKLAETGMVIFRMGLGDYTRRLYPNRSNLEVTIRKLPAGKTTGGPTSSSKTSVVRYKAIFDPNKNPQVGGTELENQSSETLNTSDFVEVHLEIVDRAMEPLRIKTTNIGAVSNVKVEDLIRSVLGGESVKVMVDGKPAVQAIDIVKPDRTELVPSIIIPHGFRMTYLPTYIQEKVGGVYSRGIGTFFQSYKGKKTWFIYPTYDTERAKGKEPIAVFYSVPQEKLPQLDKSYRLDGDILKIIITAQRKYSDNAELGLMNGGSGYRMADAKAFMKKPVEMGPNGPKGSRARLNHEVSFKERSDGLDYAPVSKSGPSANPYAARSEVLARSLAQLDVVWENANPDLLYPGMPCKYVYLNKDKPVTLRGTILFVHSLSARVEKYNAGAFRTTCRVTIACEPQSKMPDIPDSGSPNDN